MTKEYYTLKEAAEMLGVHPLTISRRIKEGKIHTVMLPISDRPKITHDELMRLITPIVAQASKPEAE